MMTEPLPEERILESGGGPQPSDANSEAPRSQRIAVIALFCLVATVAIVTITPWPVGAFQDDAIYTVLAKSLAEGEGYKLLNLPGEPNATHFPPGYPLVLAAMWKLWPSFPDNIVLFKFANAFFLAIAALGTFHFARTRLGSSVQAAAAYAIVGTLSIVVLLITGVVMSEPLFMAMMFPALMSAERAVETGKPRDAAIAGLWLGAWSLVRTLGVFAIPAAGIVLLLRRRWASVIALGAAAAIFVVPWQLWVSAHQDAIAPVLAGKFGSYGGWLTEGYRTGGWAFARDVVLRNLRDLDGMVSFLLLPVQPVIPRGIAFVGAIVLALLGTKRFARNAPVTLGFLAFYMLVVMVWPFEPNRFVLALWPLWTPLIAGGAMLLWRLRGPSAFVWPARVATAVVVLAIAGGTTWYNGMGYSRRWWNSIQRDAGQRAKPIVEWIASHTPADAVLATEDDLIVYLYTGRKAVPTSTFTPHERLQPLTDSQDAEAVRAILSSYGPQYYVVASRRGMLTAASLSEGAERVLAPYSKTPNALIYRHLAHDR
jgi:hypothetical protein